MFDFLIKGLILGIAVAAPVGPIGLLCINRTLNKNYFSGVISGMGATFADVFYGVIAGFGVSFLSNFLLEHTLTFQLVGGFALIILGVRTIMRKNSEQKENPLRPVKFRKRNYVKDFISSFALTLSNPVTILFFTAVFATFGLSTGETNIQSASLLILGVFIGSGMWWMFINGIAIKLKARVGISFISKINVVSGSLIVGFGALILLNLIRDSLI
jgi:threonine/homoserine/homoserine lactone efflux protein